MKNRLKLNNNPDHRYINGAGKYQKEQYQKRVEVYETNPKSCLNCNSILPYHQLKNNGKNTKFCSRSCAAIFNNKRRTKTTPFPAKKIYKKYKAKTLKTYECVVCKTKIKCFHKKITCSEVCLAKRRKEGARIGGLISASRQIKRSKNEIYFYELCKAKFINVLHNEPLFEGWDADVIMPDFKIAILWNGSWHYKQITKQHSLLQVQNRDRLKQLAIIKNGYVPYVIKDLGKFNKRFVEQEFNKFCQMVPEAGFEPARHIGGAL